MDDQRTRHFDATLGELVESARQAFAGQLVSVVLFGSAAEGRLRPSSDVNLLFLLASLDPKGLDAFREPLRVAQSALKARAMFLLREELPAASELFAMKFSDMQNRHRVLFGPDPFLDLPIDPLEIRRRLREVLLNLALRLRERYVTLSLREEQLVPLIADTTGPLRAAASALLRLQGKAALPPREALESVVAEIGDPAFQQAVAMLPQARELGQLPPGEAGPTLLAMIRLADRLRHRLENTPQTGA